jgi:hypothetical protein
MLDGTHKYFTITVRWLFAVIMALAVSSTAQGQANPCFGRVDLNLSRLLIDASRNLCRDLDVVGFPFDLVPGPSPEARRQARVNGFLKDLEKFRRLGLEIASYRSAPTLEPSVIRDLDSSSRELRKATDKIIEFVDWGFDYPPARVVRTSEGSLPDRLIEVGAMVEQVLPRVIELTTGHVLDLGLHREIRLELFEIKAFSTFDLER